MAQIEQLKVFVSDRLNAVTSEILSAVVKTLSDYEEQVSRLKEENERHRSLLDIIVKAKISDTEGGCCRKTSQSSPAGAAPAIKNIPAASSKPTSVSSAPPWVRSPPCSTSSDLNCVFTSRTDLIKSVGSGNCPYCLTSVPATEKHLMRKHYTTAVHFIEDGTEQFSIPCWCKDKIQKGRSHWHCSSCRKIIFRKANFERHLSKQHQFTLLEQNKDGESNQAFAAAYDEQAPLSLEAWDQQDISTVDQEVLQLKEQELKMWREVSPHKLQNAVVVQFVRDHIQKGNGQIEEGSVEAAHDQHSAPNTVSEGSYLPSVISDEQHAAEDQIEELKESHTPVHQQMEKLQKRSTSPSSVDVKKPSQISDSQDPSGPHCCKACGKTFHYMYTLRTHALRHAVDRKPVCGICGKRLESKMSLVQHLQNHKRKNKCSICGKQFSNVLCLKQHMRVHRP